jgi:phenylacetate-CoA ligase
LKFVDRNGEEVSNGERGETICTSLYNYAMPFIRYAVGDIGVSSNDICPCGRTLPLMKVIEGRKDSILILPDGRLLSPRTFTITFNMFRLIKYIEQFRIIQKRKDFFEILLKKKDMPIDEKNLKTELIEHLKKTLDLRESHVTFEIQFVENFDLDKSGKFEIVTSELKDLSNQSIG